MAAYAALVSLINNMDHIQIHPRLSSSLDNKQTESLREKVDFLLDFIETYSHGRSKETEILERQIASAAHAAEDVIESHIVDQIHAGSSSLLDLHTVIQDMDCVKEKVVIVNKNPQPIYPSPAPTSSTPLTSTGKSKMVGFEDDLLQLMDRLTGQQSNRQIIPIVGMGGSGKTTLARNLYENSLIVHHFDIRSWATISQEYNVKEIFSKLLSCQSNSTGEHQLAQQLYQSLIRRRYLIILDDMWSIEVWDRIKFFFPDNNNGSRVVVTTRLSDMAIHFGSSCHGMSFLDENKSWKLFCENAFPQEGCPSQLDEIGKKIAKKCNGLPLLIAVIGRLLSKSPVTQEYWERISKNINSNLNLRSEEQSLDILSLSYNHLPAHLKPCFLYMGIFPEDKEICVSRLIKLWVAEGFLKPNGTQNLEETAEGYLKDLVERNLILECSLRWSGKLKSCRIHDLLRDLCLKTAENEKFLCVMSICDIPRSVDEERRIVFHGRISEEKYEAGIFFNALESASLTRSLLCNWDQKPVKLRLLRVINMVDTDDSSLDGIFKQVNLRYIWTSASGQWIWMPPSTQCIPLEIRSSISLLWNLQILFIIIYGRRIVAPPEVWEMAQLRHVYVTKICLPGIPLRDQQDDDFVLRNLQTLKSVVDLRLSEEVCKRIPNVKKLKIMYEDLSGSLSRYCLYNLGRLHKLESLKCLFWKAPNPDDLLRDLKFPSSLKKLSLRKCQLEWEDLTMIGSLPHLEFLSLQHGSVRGSEWNPVEGEFLSLKYLEIDYCEELRVWNADSSHFPVLKKLVLQSLLLDEIPLAIGEIPTLGVIDLNCCSESAAISAMRILEEQETEGNEDFRVKIHFYCEKDLETFREQVEGFQSFTSNNLQFSVLTNWDY